MTSHTHGGDSMPSVPEHDARGETADIYADIRAVLAVPLVNLVWRHLAVFPGALPWCWSTVRPLYASGAIDTAALALRAGLRLPTVATIPVAHLDAIGVDDTQRRAVGAVLDAYEAGNSQNLVALTALRLALDGGPRRVASPGQTPPASERPMMPVTPTLPPIPAVEALAAEDGLALRTLNALGADASVTIVASAYRHLGYWPGLLGLCARALEPLADVLHPAIAAAREDARRLAAGLVGRLTLDTPDAEITTTVEDVIDRFTGEAIGRMVVMVPLARRALLGGPNA
ncbi:MAG: hypothetical protein H6983_09415 [Ectothiorhodospiraceae bacterium]|nr:hypothetical protein [Chromatiales bacterium]MCP5154371.1 hypothetical protein [Ectothiorhodospiraceae bacterium]